MTEPVYPTWSARFALAHPPMGKVRARSRVVTPKGEKPFVHVYPDPDGERDEKAIAKLAERYAPPAPLRAPISLEVTATVRVPSSWSEWERAAALEGRIRPTSGRGGVGVGGDVDNFAKQMLDALTRSGRWWVDDAQVVDLVARKVYAAELGWIVIVHALPEPSRAEWKAEKAAAGVREGLFGGTKG